MTYSSAIPPHTASKGAGHLLQLRVLPTTLIFFVIILFILAFYSRFTATQSSGSVSSSSLLFHDIRASFYKNSNILNGKFDITPLNAPIFTESFPIIAFNPDPSTQRCRKSTGVNIQTRPFTDVLQNPDGTCETIGAQDDRGHMAGLGNLYAFEAMFLTSFTVPSKGFLTIQIRADDGWILSIGANSNGGKQPTPQSTKFMAHSSVDNKSPIHKFLEMGDNNRSSSPTLFKVIVNLPAAGTYPVEIDYTECCGGSLTLVVSNVFTPLQS